MLPSLVKVGFAFSSQSHVNVFEVLLAPNVLIIPVASGTAAPMRRLFRQTRLRIAAGLAWLVLTGTLAGQSAPSPLKVGRKALVSWFTTKGFAADVH